MVLDSFVVTDRQSRAVGVDELGTNIKVYEYKLCSDMAFFRSVASGTNRHFSKWRQVTMMSFTNESLIQPPVNKYKV